MLNNCIRWYTFRWQIFMALLTNRISIIFLRFNIHSSTNCKIIHDPDRMAFLRLTSWEATPANWSLRYPSCCLNKLTLSISRSVDKEIKAKRKLITLENRLVFKGWGPSGTLLVERKIHHSSTTPNKHLQNVEAVVDRDAVVAFHREAFLRLHLGTYQENGIGSLGT